MNSSLLTIWVGALLGFLSCIVFITLNIRSLRQTRVKMLSQVDNAEKILNAQIAQLNISELLLTEAGKELLIMLDDISLPVNNESVDNFPETQIQEKIEQALQEISKQEGNDFAEEIRPIILRNYERGRVEASLDSPNDSLQGYMQTVVENYKHRSQYIHDLQVEKSTDVWEPLLKDMEKWAYRFLVKKNYSTDDTTWEYAKECATEAATNILSADFPYDIEFDAWARVLVQNACLKLIHSSINGSPTFEEGADDNLIEAITQLSSLRRQVIEMRYFQDLSPSEIATKLGRSIRDIHILQFHALRDLRKILNQSMDKFAVIVSSRQNKH